MSADAARFTALIGQCDKVWSPLAGLRRAAGCDCDENMFGELASVVVCPPTAAPTSLGGLLGARGLLWR